MNRMNHKKGEKMQGVSRMEECPKCGFKHQPGDKECLSCGIVYKKYETYILRTKNAQEEAKKQKNAEDKPWRRKETPPKSVNTRSQLKGAAYAVCAITIFMAIYLAIFGAKPVEGNGIKLASDATVAIKTGRRFVGSGFFISEDGYILTNKHVIAVDEKRLAEVEQELNREKYRIEQIESSLDDLLRIIEQKRTRLLKTETWLRKTNEILDSYPFAQKQTYEYSLLVMQYNSGMSLYKLDRREFKMLENDYLRLGEEREREMQEYGKGIQYLRDLKYREANQNGFTIKMKDGTTHSAFLVEVSDRYDLALLQLAGVETSCIEISNVEQVEVGEPLYAIGHPLGFEYSVTSGIFSGYRTLENVEYIQTNAQINKGSSGGPLIDKKGRVIGINTIKMVGKGIEGISFAIPIKTALEEFERHLR